VIVRHGCLFRFSLVRSLSTREKVMAKQPHHTTRESGPCGEETKSGGDDNLVRRWAPFFDWIRIFASSGNCGSNSANNRCAVQTDWTLLHTTHSGGAIQEWYEAHMEEKLPMAAVASWWHQKLSDKTICGLE
jgi:hypothetical protein